MSRATINPGLLVWARERADLSHAQVAQKLGVKEESVRLWEVGDQLPTLRQAQGLARVLHIPFGYLFLSKPPQTVTPIADFRTLPQAQRGRFSLELEETLNDAMRKRDWLREWRVQEGFEPLPFVGSVGIQTHPEVVAEDIRREIDIPRLPPRNVRTWEEYLRFLVRRTEERGILILQNSVTLGNNFRPLSVEEFRGFTLTDTYAPVIFINTRDTFAGRIFTLAHECAHLWTGTSGISNPSLREIAEPIEVERFCNRVAAELLVPSDLFVNRWQETIENDLFEKSQILAATFRVSVFVILLRALEKNLVNRDAFRHAYEEALEHVEPQRESSGNGADFYNTWRVRNGRVLVQELLTALRHGDVLYREAAQLLNVRSGTLESILQKF